MTEIQWVGGSEADRSAVLAQHDAYLQANAKLDWDHLESVFSPEKWAEYFNLNGFIYKGREHWIRLWKYYITQHSTGYWQPFDMTGFISGDLATVWAQRKTFWNWTGADQRYNTERQNDEVYETRSTMIFHREDGDWKIVHVHFSNSKEGGERPGGI